LTQNLQLALDPGHYLLRSGHPLPNLLASTSVRARPVEVGFHGLG